jgi:undecaprenyl pyrophosphate phosphatase UppP
VVDERPGNAQPGWPQVILVGAAVVVAVLAAAALTGFLPTPIQEAIFHEPVLIVVLIVGTSWLLWRISRGRPVDDEQ